MFSSLRRILGALATVALLAVDTTLAAVIDRSGSCSDEPYRAAPFELKPADYSVPFNLDPNTVIFQTEPHFLSVTFDANSIPNHFDSMPWNDPGLVEMCAALQPTLLRFGGTEADWITYDMNEEETENEQVVDSSDTVGPPPTPRPLETLLRKDFDDFTNFLNQVGWQMIFGLNALDRNQDGSWNATNSLSLIHLVSSNRTRYPIIGFELGNEPDIMSRAGQAIPPAQLVQDTFTLQSLIDPDQFIVGYDVATPYWNNYFNEVLETIESLGKSPIQATTIHHYYRHNNDSTIEAVLDPAVLDQLSDYIVNATGYTMRWNFTLPLWLGETSSFSGGGSLGVSDRFASGFLWMDKLGLAARMGIPMLFRQTLRSNEDSIPNMSYGLLTSNILPNPDLFTSVLYKRLVGTQVLDVKLGGTSSQTALRAYAHCVQNTTLYPSGSLPAGSTTPGAFTLLVISLAKLENIQLAWDPSLLPLLGPTRLEFRLSASQMGSDWEETIASRHMKLNGFDLLSQCNGSLPHMPGRSVNNDVPFVMEPLTYGFVVFPSAELPACGFQASQDDAPIAWE